MSFIPRLHFPFPTNTPSWFAGHMSTSLTKLPTVLKDIDLVIEARDARLPLTSINPAFDEVLEESWGKMNTAGPSGWKGKGKEKVVVYTKRDQAEERFEEPLKRAFKKYANQSIFFADTRSDRDVRRVLAHAVDVSKRNFDPLHDMKVLVVGMPNVGKSSLLNALRRVGVRKGKAFQTSSLPGHTRKFTGTVKVHETPPVYVYDMAGIMVPYLGKGEEGMERGLKLGLTSGIKESLFPPEILADYLLYRMNLHPRFTASTSPYPGLPLPPAFTDQTNALEELLTALAKRLGTLMIGGIPDVDAAQRYLLKSFGEGKLGRWTLDDLISDPATAGRTRSVLEDEGVVEGEDSESPAQPEQELGLTAAVDRTVSAYLRDEEERRTRRADGIPESLSQEKKKARKSAVEERKKKWEAKMANAGGIAPGSRKTRR